jgi:hypothetical protein
VKEVYINGKSNKISFSIFPPESVCSGLIRQVIPKHGIIKTSITTRGVIRGLEQPERQWEIVT